MGQRTKITSIYLAALKLGKDNGEYVIDSGVRGQGALVMRVTDSARPFYYRYFHDGKRRFELVGYFDSAGARSWQDGAVCHKGGPVTLSAAREGFQALIKLQNAIGDLKVHYQREIEITEATRRAADLEARLGTFQQLLDVYIASLRDKGKVSAVEAHKVFRRNVSEPFKDLVARQAREITPEDIQFILGRIVERGATRQVNVTRSYLNAAFTYAGAGHDYDPRRIAAQGVAFRLLQNPVSLVPRIASFDRMGYRTLSEDEIRAYFRLLDDVPGPLTKAFLKVHILTGGQRPRQLIAAPWTSYDLAEGVVSIIDGKGRGAAREHLVPLLPEVIKILRDVKKISGDFAAPFVNRKDTSLRLETLVKAVTAIATREKDEKPIFETPFTLRDIRRTVETRLVDLGISKEVRSQLLSHDRGGKIEQTYNKNDYLKQKRLALRTWVNFLQNEDDARKVIRIGKGKRIENRAGTVSRI